ncbi:MAG TPA: Ku protein [Kofleriaceae bacterium]|jgi:DNA end-binding protein Ku
MPARSIDTATIAFGLVSIPVKIYSTNEPSHEIHFHFIHEGCGERVKQFYECPKHGKVDRSEMTKGFELTKGNFVELSKEELKNLEAVASEEIEMREFVPISAVDPMYIDATYYLGPAKGAERAYRLLRDAMESEDLAGIAAYSARGKQYVVMLRPFEDGLAMHQLRYLDEVKPWKEVPIGTLPKPPAQELQLATKVIGQLKTDEVDLSKYKDEVKGRVRKLIASKAKGGEILAPDVEERAPIPDLMAALKASLSGEAPKAKASKRTAAKSHTTRAPARKSATSHARTRAARPQARSSSARARRQTPRRASSR